MVRTLIASAVITWTWRLQLIVPFAKETGYQTLPLGCALSAKSWFQTETQPLISKTVLFANILTLWDLLANVTSAKMGMNGWVVSVLNPRDVWTRFPIIQNASAALLTIISFMILKPAYVCVIKATSSKKLIEPQCVWASVEIRLRQGLMKNAMMAISEKGMAVIRTVNFNPILFVHSRPQANAVCKSM